MMKRMKPVMYRLQAAVMAAVVLFGLQADRAAGQGDGLKWLRIGKLQNYFTEVGAEYEGSNPAVNFGQLYWPADYGLKQTSAYSKALWMGSKNFYDQSLGRTLPVKVVGAGPRKDANTADMIFPVMFKSVGRFDHPAVVVNDEIGSINDIYDILDEIDPNLPCDRMIVSKFHTSLGVTVTRKIMAWGSSNHDDYFIYDMVFKNTGIINGNGDVYQQTLDDFDVCFISRYTLVGEGSAAWNMGWAPWSASWGVNTVNQVVGTDPLAADYEYRAMFSWFGPHSQMPLTVDGSWGCPQYLHDGLMSAARYAGTVVLHADKSGLDGTDDPYQPKTTHYQGSDSQPMMPPYSQSDESSMQARYDIMAAGHAVKTHAEEVGGDFADQWGNDLGGYSQTQGFGPYTLAPGDSIRIVLAEGVAGLSREKNREVGANWLAYYNGTGAPVLVGPDGSVTADHDEYKRAWVWSCADSLEQTCRNAILNYSAGYSIPAPPPPPQSLHVESGEISIMLSWDDNAESWPNFDGYAVYRSAGSVMEPETRYQKIFECSAYNAVHEFHDITAVRGFEYYYAVVSRDDGSFNDVRPGVPLTSSLFWTLTSVPARLRVTVDVYPGDTDHDGVVDEMDILPVGYYFHFMGAPRDSVSLAWFPSRAEVWNVLGAEHADANGDGIVDEKDVIGIGVNWGNTHEVSSESSPVTLNQASDPAHRDAFIQIYRSLRGESEAVRSMKKLLAGIIGETLPADFSLSQNVPNPFNPVTEIRFALPESREVNLVLYNMLGQQVRTVLNKRHYEAGFHSVILDADGLESGLYIYRIEAGEWSLFRKMIVVK